MLDSTTLDIQTQLQRSLGTTFEKGSKREKKRKKESGKRLFSLERAITGTENRERVKFDLEEQFAEIKELGERFRKSQKYVDLQRYRTAVKDLLNHVVQKGFLLEEESGIRNPATLDRKKYTLIRQVDTKLERAVSLFLQEQRATLEVIQMLGEVQGLLIDILG